MGYETLFNYRPLKDLVNYMSSYNAATQAVDLESDGGIDFKWTGTAQCVVNGAYVASLSAVDPVNLSDAAVAMPDPEGVALAGYISPDNEQFYLLITTEADATPHVYLASNRADDVGPTFKMPYYGPDELPIAFVLYDNNDLGAALTLGTSILSVDDDTWTQLTGPALLPHVDNIDRN